MTDILPSPLKPGKLHATMAKPKKPPRKRRPSDDTPRIVVMLGEGVIGWLNAKARAEDRTRNYVIARMLREAMLAEQNQPTE